MAVPAHDEAASLPAALDSIHRARNLAPLPPCTVVVAAYATAARHGANVVEVSHRMAGASRAAAVARALRTCGTRPEETWIATTDAGCRVPPDWLAHHLCHALRGRQRLLGTVRIAPHPSLVPPVRAPHDAHCFAGRDGPGWVHPHVHGANLGIRADTHLRAGGFPAVPYGEDHAFVAAPPSTTRALRTDACPVTASGRTAPRAPHGFGAFPRALGELAEDVETEPGSSRRAARTSGTTGVRPAVAWPASPARASPVFVGPW
ncbi:glycosyl transferase [Streptomyces sp. NPDC012450]|uniref:glycosyl transferase n=1 Tax=Streptomyces sp. NPDC012450 TaxID=3364834 RepID=UPI0036ED2D7A